MIAKALLTVAKLGNVEFLFKVSTANPELISMVTFSQRKGHAFFNAVEYHQAEIFSLLRGFHFRNVLAAMFNENHDNLLHTAAKLAPASNLTTSLAVESVVNPRIELRLNKEGLTPLDYFKKNHKELRNEGEKWMKDTASSCSVVGALIVTIVFATAFIVLGGNDQASGYPIFLKDRNPHVTLCRRTLPLFLTHKIDHRPFYAFSLNCNYAGSPFRNNNHHGAT
ncbi:uncharacterized protein LOC114712220 [Neltuma alba]|uniref:uncharacterized protein LOC114712220 n=1 Tax=Neltuma alba TaxID=207710 RepID=UPI0010A3E627|nr:uncharacterized protein LOC114712220 [Prosopis alba]